MKYGVTYLIYSVLEGIKGYRYDHVCVVRVGMLTDKNQFAEWGYVNN